ncbi:putative hsp70 nucleotide exchange factor [Clavispora lusitaniae]|uniref:Hsp70 nucleotide exchange factor n=1 Tax=Clavispora lusitaniae TaxID=36911 RepID=A0ACD0WMJ6_CLALS|nr:putative hsp70 nucleotide exchange factor [Clavispora lusitaniae]QFZ34119.1 putative hsp70 nucleotide exchange factor [Clavispora lusitaniae]QFZ39803.1 putative hsp70 nucleotide exchange factor [Clavispora lusitaniae]QFZ45485.1 putative hsp70 nucleotide exchange factor [Clavispora lusitaniae]QFZ51149.1 putative hsp70 nucleotide exchange factor [Clavispora lusitaniae]
MDKLLQWSIAQQSGDKEAMERIGQPDPEMLKQLFGGPDEPTLMKQAIEVVNNPEATQEAKEVALENFEMLIENMDNANNIENMKLWPSVIAQLQADAVSLRVLSASIVAIATQNNPASQEAFFKADNGFSQLIELASADSTPKDLRMKCLFALSSTVRNYKIAADRFVELGGFKALQLHPSNDDQKMSLRKLSLLSALLSTGLDNVKTEHFQSERLVENLIDFISVDGHIGCIDKTLNILSQLHAMKFPFTESEITQLASKLDAIDHMKDQLSYDDFETAKKVVS